MILFLFVLLIILCFYMFYYFNNKLSSLRRQFIVLKRDITAVKDKSSAKNSTSTSSIKIEYSSTNYKSGVIKNQCSLLLNPLDNSIPLATLAIDTFIEIKSSAKVSDELWFEIFVPSLNETNSKGWVKNSNLTLTPNIYSKET